MTVMYLAASNGIVVITGREGYWRAAHHLDGLPAYCVAADSDRPETVYCGTFGRGIWRSTDAGSTWAQVGDGLPYGEVMSVATSSLERVGDRAVVWAGTEPSALCRSEDGGATWTELPALKDLPSAPTWSFPPRPWTSHVRWIVPDPCFPERLYVGIELGGVMRSLDRGQTWEDRKPNSQFDAHTLRMHRDAPERIYEAAGGGYAESSDGGATWRRHDEGLTRHYVWGLAVDPGDPDTLLISAAPGPRQAHSHPGEAGIYRRVKDGPWREVRDGLPPPEGTRSYVLTVNAVEPGSFYAATREGDVYRSTDAGLSWSRLEIQWPDAFRPDDVGGFIVEEI